MGDRQGPRGRRRHRRRTTGGWRLVRAVPVVLVAALLLTALSSSAWADRGVAVDVGRVDVDEQVHPGERYTLPTIGVRNPGSEPGAYEMSIQSIESDRSSPPPEWFEVTPRSFALDAGGRQPAEVALQLPRDAEAGDYEALISAQLTTDDGGARVGAAAATRVTFSVADGSAPRSLPEWLLQAAAVVAATALLGGVSRRYSFKVERRR